MWRSGDQSAREVELDLEVSSWIEGRGVRHTDWVVRLRDAWIPIQDLPEIDATRAEHEVAANEIDPLRVLPPGCQYRITYHLRLPIGTALRRRVSSPRPDVRRREPPPKTLNAAVHDVLAAFPPPKPPLKTTLTDFRIAGPDRLLTEAEWNEERARSIQRVELGRAALTTD